MPSFVLLMLQSKFKCFFVCVSFYVFGHAFGRCFFDRLAINAICCLFGVFCGGLNSEYLRCCPGLPPSPSLRPPGRYSKAPSLTPPSLIKGTGFTVCSRHSSHGIYLFVVCYVFICLFIPTAKGHSSELWGTLCSTKPEQSHPRSL